VPNQLASIFYSGQFKQMRIKFIMVVFVSVFLSACSSSINEAVTSFQVQTPRPFGYVIGDEIKQRIIVDVRKGLTLQLSSIPSKGEVNRWLNLNNIAIDQSKTQQGIRYQIELTYQLFYAPLEVKMLELPGFTLQFSQFGKPIEKSVPSWSFTSAPLRELAIRKEAGKEYMRPDTPAPYLDASATLNRLIAGLLIAIMIAVYLAWLYGLLTFLPRYQIFKRPARQLAKLPDNDLAGKLSIMHKALNQLNGKPLFKHQLHDFYQRFPVYQQLHSELIWFFNYSNQHYFSELSPGNPTENAKITALCQQCLQIERGKR